MIGAKNLNNNHAIGRSNLLFRCICILILYIHTYFKIGHVLTKDLRGRKNTGTSCEFTYARTVESLTSG